MTNDSRAELRGFVAGWQIASARLTELRREELRNVRVAEHIEALNGAFEALMSRMPERASGLVEQQAVFARMKNAGSVPPRG